MRRILVPITITLLLPALASAATVTWSSRKLTRPALPAAVDSTALRAAAVEAVRLAAMRILMARRALRARGREVE